MDFLRYLAVAMIAYLIGAIPVGLVLGKALRGIDIRAYGSGKTGATNVLRALGARAAVATLLGDIAKGTVGVLIGRYLLLESGLDAAHVGEIVGGMAAVVGHNWPVYIGGRGGRGVAATLGATLAISPLAAILTLPVALLIIVVSDMASLGSLLGTVLGLSILGLLIAMGQLAPVYALFALLAGGMIVFQHWDNVQRLLRGEERKLGIRTRVRGRNTAPLSTRHSGR